MSHYTEQIDSLIVEAEKYADEEAAKIVKKWEFRPGADGTPFKFDYWTAHFHRKMNELARERGLR